MFIVTARVLLVVAAIYIAVSALRYRILRRPVMHGFFKDGRVGIDVAGIDHTHKVAEDSISTADRMADGKVVAKLHVVNDGSMATKYSLTAHLKDGSPEVYDRLVLDIKDENGETRWQGPVSRLDKVGQFYSVLPVERGEDLHMELSQVDLNMQGDVEVEFDVYANPLGADTNPYKHYPRVHLPRYWHEEPWDKPDGPL